MAKDVTEGKVFFRLDDFAEEVRYYFRNGGSRTISAQVNREPLSFYNKAGQVVTPSYEITIPNDCTKGVQANKVDTGGDQVEIIEETGDKKPEKLTVIKMSTRDLNGTIRLALK